MKALMCMLIFVPDMHMQEQHFRMLYIHCMQEFIPLYQEMTLLGVSTKEANYLVTDGAFLRPPSVFLLPRLLYLLHRVYAVFL
jgi:hypothetical protein